MRLLHVCKYDVPERGGMEKVAHELCAGLSAMEGVASDMLAVSETMAPVNFPYRIFRGSVALNLSAAPLSWGYARQYFSLINSYDIVHLHHPNPLATLLVCLYLPRAKLIVHWHSDIIRQKYSYKLFRFLERQMLKRAAAIIVTSPPYAHASKPLQDFQDRVHTIPIGIPDCAGEAMDKQDLLRVTSEYEGRKVIFGLGRLVSYKGFGYAIEAMRHVPGDAVLLIGGTGPLEPALEARIRLLGLSHKVKLLGRLSRSQCLALYRLCDIFCLSSVSRAEAFGVVQLEAMCFSKPVVSTRIEGSGVDWVNVDGETGLIAEPQSAEALADAICRLLADPALKQRLGKNGRRRYESLFREETMVRRTLELYGDIL